MSCPFYDPGGTVITESRSVIASFIRTAPDFSATAAWNSFGVRTTRPLLLRDRPVFN
jgi:hypothetical protein